jgi:endoglucanase
LSGAVVGGATNPNGFAIRRGVNISHWLSQVPEEAFPHHAILFTELDAAFLAGAGFDHVRLPVDEKELWTEGGEAREENWARLHRGIGESLRQGLNVIVDLHIIRSHYFNAVNEGAAPNTLFDDPGAQAQFLELWGELSSRLGEYPVDRLAYEILNEAMADDPEDWNRLLASAHRVIREREPERTLVMGSNIWQTASTFPDLVVPAGDPNLILSFHNYSPMLITHYRASWTPARAYEGPVQYPGPSVEEAYANAHYEADFVETLRNMGAFREHSRGTTAAEIEVAVDRAQVLGLPLYCGEFGCLPSPGRAIRLRYYRDLVSIFVEHGIAYANWDYRGDFRIVDRDTLVADHELIQILTGKLVRQAKAGRR